MLPHRTPTPPIIPPIPLLLKPIFIPSQIPLLLILVISPLVLGGISAQPTDERSNDDVAILMLVPELSASETTYHGAGESDPEALHRGVEGAVEFPADAIVLARAGTRT